MARIRSVHPGLFKDEAFMELSMAARVLAIGIWTICDDHGIFEWKPKVIRADIFPGDNVEIDGLMGELIEYGLVERFAVDGRNYGAVRNFCLYQRPKKPFYRHPFPPELPSYVGVDRRKEQEEVQASSTSTPPVGKRSRTSTEKSPHKERREEESSRREENPKTNTESLERVSREGEGPKTLSQVSTQVLKETQVAANRNMIGTPLAVDWIPSDALCQAVKADFSMTDADLQREVPAFHALNAQNGTISRDWDATFRLFCKRWREHQDKQAPPRVELSKAPSSSPMVMTESLWHSAMKFYANTGRWNAAYGPDPMTGKCHCPIEIMERYGVDPDTGERTIPPKAVSA